MHSADELETSPTEEIFEFPASVAQEAFFYLEQVEPGVTPFNIAVRFILKGALDKEALLMFN